MNRHTALVLGLACTLLTACASAPTSSEVSSPDGSPWDVGHCDVAEVSEGLRARFEPLWEAFEARGPLWCALMGSDAGAVMVGGLADGALLVQWPDAEVLKVPARDAEALRFAQHQDPGGPDLCAFPSALGQGSVHKVPIFSAGGRGTPDLGAPDATVPIRGRVWSLGPPSGSLCRAVFVSDLRYQLAERGVPMSVGIEGRVVALSKHAEAWDYYLAP